MAEATFQNITLPFEGEEPFIGDLNEGEIAINVADGRVWAGDSIGTPIELGGAVKNRPMGSLFFSNYLDVEITSPDNLPISNTNPLDVAPGFYQEERILIRFTQNPLQNFSTYFDYPVNWGVDWTTTNPIDFYKGQGKKILIELSSFGPSTEWIGRLLWVSSNSET